MSNDRDKWISSKAWENTEQLVNDLADEKWVFLLDY